MSIATLNNATTCEIADALEGAHVIGKVDLGAALLVRAKNSVIGEFIAVTTVEGNSALIRL